MIRYDSLRHGNDRPTIEEFNVDSKAEWSA